MELDSGQRVKAYCPNPGRMEELFTGGEMVSLRIAPPQPKGAKPRTTTHDVLGVFYQDQWVSIDTRLPNALVGAVLLEHAIPELADWDLAKAEYTWGSSRFDFLLSAKKSVPSAKETYSGPPASQVGSELGQALLEVKSCTLVEEGIAMFPDAPTVRGARHLRELVLARRDNFEAFALFCIQRNDAQVWRPHHEMDPDFAHACLEAQKAGVQLLAYGCDFDGVTITPGSRVPIDLSHF